MRKVYVGIKWDVINVSTSCRSLVYVMHSVVAFISLGLFKEGLVCRVCANTLPCEPHRDLPQCASAYANARALRHVQLRTVRST
jgi:hypothetical protein